MLQLFVSVVLAAELAIFGYVTGNLTDAKSFPTSATAEKLENAAGKQTDTEETPPPTIQSDELWEKIDNGEIKLVQEGWDSLDLLFYIKTLDELERESSDIVAGTFLNDSREDKIVTPGGDVLYGCTITSFKISNVYKGNLSVGDVIPLGEEFYTQNGTDSNGGLELVFSAEYLPHRAGKEYLFFLTKTPETNSRYGGIYASTQFERGRYPVISPDLRNADVSMMSNDELGIGDGPSATYRNIYEEVIKKYM